jgi:DNA-directed RNA polymerase specialized sigma24 family protein
MLPVRDGDSEDEGREPPAAEPEDPNADVYRDLSRIELRERIASLEPKLRDAARLLMDGLAISEIAGRIGVARSSLYRYILPELRKALAEFAGAF